MLAHKKKRAKGKWSRTPATSVSQPSLKRFYCTNKGSLYVDDTDISITYNTTGAIFTTMWQPYISSVGILVQCSFCTIHPVSIQFHLVEGRGYLLCPPRFTTSCTPVSTCLPLLPPPASQHTDYWILPASVLLRFPSSCSSMSWVVYPRESLFT